jgi:uncharacterized damage-inducible protein DinB
MAARTTPRRQAHLSAGAAQHPEFQALLAMRAYLERLAALPEEPKRRTAQGWTAAEIVDHLALVEEGYLFRTTQFFRANEVGAVIANDIRSYAPPPLNASVRRFALLRARVLSRLRRAKANDRKRTLRMRGGGVRTLAAHLRAMVAHDDEHRAQIEALLRRG